MKRKFIFILCLGFIFTSIVNTAHADVEQRRTELLKVLDEELREVTRLNKQIGSQRPDLMLRMAQILLEKGRLLKDLENQKYLEIPAIDREKTNKEDAFKESRRYFDQAQKTVLVLLKKFPKFDERADAYYILAYNAKEIKQDDQSKKFFQKALDESRGGSVVGDKSRIALAEIYFNKGSFDKSMTLYEAALKSKRDKWWTKDAFNLGWSYFKMGKYDKAISIMTESYELSKNNKFIDMSKSIERDLAFFYTEAGRSDEAIAFYKKNGKSVSEVMLKVGRYLKTQGKYAAAEKTLGDGIQFKQNEKEEIDFNIELLSLYEKFGRDQKHLEACRALALQFSKGTLNADQVDILKFNVQKMSAMIQRQLVDKIYDHKGDIRDKKAEASNEYFMINALVNPSKSQEDYFHAGETYFAIGKYDKAVPLYAESIKRAQKNTDKKTEGLASNALMVSLGKGVKKATSEEFLIPAYESFLSSTPKGEKSSVVYQRLFSAYMEKKNVASASIVLMNYKTALPVENETQEKMLAQVMDFYKDKGDKVSLANWVKRIDSNEFKVSPEYAKKVKTLVLGMQFEKVEQASTKGDKKGALRGYLQIYKSLESDFEAKKTAAYNIAVLFYETGDYKQMFSWADRSASMMGVPELIKFEKDYILFSTDLFQRRQFTESANLSEKIFDKLCASDSKNKRVFFKNANVIYLAERQFEKSKNLLAKAPKCGIGNDIILQGYLDHLNELAAASKWSSFNDIIHMLEVSKEMWPQLIYPSSLLANELENIGRVDDSKKVRSRMMFYYDNSKKQKLDIPLEALDAISLIRLSSLEAQLRKLNETKFAFPEVEYNKTLKSKFAQLDRISTEAVSIAEMGSGIGIVKAYRYLVSGHESLRDEVINFTPEGKSPEYIASFKKSMAKLVEPLSKQAREFRETAIKKIEKENILSADNGWFLIKNEYSFIPEFFSESGSALMDKAGTK
ncbi:MAG: tetratricopeptide repeat protein [Bacteriovorax sp.]|nr:tetratricopeptide repeat protein [Bacteriovorax sp.]